MLLQITISVPQCSPLPADYVHKDYMGLAGVFVGLGAVLGDVVALGILFPLTAHMTPKASFATVAVTIAILTIPIVFLVKEPKLRNDSLEED